MTTGRRRDVAVLGLGPMGAPIAANLVAAGHRVGVWNRTAARTEALVAAGANAAARPADLDGEVIFSVLPDVDQLLELLDEETRESWRGRLLVIMSTTSPERVRRLAAELDSYEIEVADAPMSGGDRGAREATLSIMVGCRAESWPRLRPVLETIGSTIVRFGEIGDGSAAKLCNQVVVAGTLTALAESLALAERLGLNMADLVGILEGGLASSAVLALKREKLLAREYEPGGNAVNQLKDLRYARAAGAAVDAQLPVTEVAEALFSELVTAGRGAEDHSVVLEALRAQNAAGVADRS